MSKKLENYIKGLIDKGYNISAIRGNLLNYGYTSKEIDDAISSSYNPTIRHEIHLSHTTVFVLAIIFISILGAASFFYYGSAKQKTETKLLDLNLEPITTTAAPGQYIVFIKELSNLGSSKRYDVVIRQDIIDAKTNQVITQKIETRAIETFGSTQTKIQIPNDARAGDYILRAVVEYDNKKAIATLPIKIVPLSDKASCNDGIKNQNEEGTDCGGICEPCKNQTTDCDDSNICTDDILENGKCQHKQITPCCGNLICEDGENSSNCAIDCPKKQVPVDQISTNTLDDIKEVAKTDPSKALQMCKQIEVPDIKDTCIGNIGEVQKNKNYCLQIANQKVKDLCYLNIAQLINDNSLCEEMSKASTKDSCYMNFVLDNKDYTVCDKITNTQLRNSCDSLRQLSEINSQNQTQG